MLNDARRISEGEILRLAAVSGSKWRPVHRTKFARRDYGSSMSKLSCDSDIIMAAPSTGATFKIRFLDCFLMDLD